MGISDINRLILIDNTDYATLKLTDLSFRGEDCYLLNVFKKNRFIHFPCFFLFVCFVSRDRKQKLLKSVFSL